VLRPRDEAEGSEAAPVVGLSRKRTPERPRAEWLLEHGRVVTFAGGGAASAVAIGGGRVLAIGRPAALRPWVDARTVRVDCLIDPHLHLFALAVRDAHLDCAADGIAGVDDLLHAVRSHAACLPRGAWLRGEGLDEGRLGRLPTAAELAQVAGGRPVRLRHRSRHASVLSADALARIPGLPADARRSGLVAGREDLVRRVVGPLAADVLDDGLARAGEELAAVGLTCVADATPRSARGLAPLRRLMQGGRFPLRVFAMRPLGTRAWPATGRLRPGPVKLLVEEGPDGMRPRAATLARRIARAAVDGQVAVHVVGAGTLVAALAAFAALPRRHRVGRRHRLEHVAECPPPLVSRIAALGLVVVTNPAFVHWRGDAYCQETPAAARPWLYRAASLARAGVPLAAASDAPVVTPNPWVGVAAARARRTRLGRTLGASERLGAAAALALFTRGAAFSLGADALGRLVPGAPADVVVVEPDPLAASADEVAAARVRLTLVGGRQVWPR
jgi:predicted amidohydrolase YtcJ